MIDICQEADIELFELVLRTAQLLEELLIGRDDLEIFFVFEETSRYFGVTLKLSNILLDGVLYACVLVRRVHICLSKDRKAFVLRKHHQRNSKSASVSRDLENVICIFELLLDHLHSLAGDYRASILESRDFVQLQKSHLKTDSSDLILQMAQIFLAGLVLSPPFFETQLIDNRPNYILNVGLESLHDNVLTFSLKELIIPVAVKDLLIIFA